MFLALRMALYAAFGTIAGQGFDFFTFDEVTGDFTIIGNLESLTQAIVGYLGMGATFVWSYWDQDNGPDQDA